MKFYMYEENLIHFVFIWYAILVLLSIPNSLVQQRDLLISRIPFMKISFVEWQVKYGATLGF